MVSAVSMSMSSVSVVLSSLWLNFYKKPVFMEHSKLFDVDEALLGKRELSTDQLRPKGFKGGLEAVINDIRNPKYDRLFDEV